MPQTIEVTTYSYSELDAKAQEKARDWWKRCEAETFGCHADDVDTYDTKEVARILGIEFKQRPVQTMGGKTRYESAIWWSLYPTYGTFEGEYKYAKGCSRAIRRYAPKDERLHTIADGLTALQRAHGYQLQATLSGDCQRSTCEVRRVFRNGDDSTFGWNPDGTKEEPARELAGLLRDFGNWIARQIEADYDYRMSDENVAESIEANEYRFLADGSLSRF